MADYNDILQVLNEEARSTQAIMVEFPEFQDRSFAAQFLGNMYRSGLIKKRSNGYWSVTTKGKQRMEETESQQDDPETEMGGKSPQANTQESVMDVPSLKSPGAMEPPHKPEPAPTATEADSTAKSGDSWQLLGYLKGLIPDDASLVIESNQAFIFVAGLKFAIQQPGDLDAILLAAERCERVAA